MKDKETQNNIFDILDKMEFFQGQRAGRELWNDKPKEVQDKDIADFIKDINYIRSYLQDSVVLTEKEYIDLSRNYVREQIEQARKETAKKILIGLYFNLQSSVQGKVTKSNDYYNVDGWIKEIAKEYGVEIEE